MIRIFTLAIPNIYRLPVPSYSELKASFSGKMKYPSAGSRKLAGILIQIKRRALVRGICFRIIEIWVWHHHRRSHKNLSGTFIWIIMEKLSFWTDLKGKE